MSIKPQASQAARYGTEYQLQKATHSSVRTDPDSRSGTGSALVISGVALSFVEKIKAVQPPSLSTDHNKYSISHQGLT